MKNNYDDFLKRAKETGLLASFSKYDMALAEKNPDAGMSILNYKLDYINAKSDEERRAANMGAETVRYTEGNYYGGKNGSSFYSAMRPEKEEKDNSSEELYRALKDSYSKGYGEKYENKLREIEERDPFSYDPEKDELYSAYRKQYIREGKRAAADTVGEISARTGGAPSSYGVTAAAQAQNYYMGKLTDKIPELYSAAYGRYRDEGEKDLALLQLYGENAERDHDRLYTLYKEALKGDEAANEEYEAELERYYRERDYRADQAQKQFENALDVLKYKQSEEQRLKENADSDEDRQRALDSEEYERIYEKAALAAKYGDYSLLKELGIEADVENLKAGSGVSSSEKNSLYDSDPNYMYVSNYGYMKSSVVHQLIRDGVVVPYYNTQTGKYSYIYAG